MRTPGQRISGQRTFFGVLLTLAASALVLSPIAMAAPSQSEIDAAREAEQLAEYSVAQLEIYLATTQANANTALVTAQKAAEDLNAAQVRLDEATALAEKTQAEADSAQAAFEDGRTELATVVQTAYRTGSASLDALAPYLTSDGLETVEARQNAINKFGGAVDTKLQEVAALQQVANVMAESAKKAKEEQEAAVEVVKAREAEARDASAAAQAAQADAQLQYEAGLEELAIRQNTTTELVRQQQEAIEAQRAEAERQAALERAARDAAQDEQEEAQTPSRSESRPSTGSSNSNSSSNNPAPVQTSKPKPVPTSKPAPEPQGSGVSGAIAYAKQLIGAPYVWGGEGPGYDCSGLVTVAFRSVGIYLTHQSQSQYYETSRVSIDALQAGDLVFWSSNGSGSGIYHVAIYLGNNQIIEAPTFGVPVRITSIYNWGDVMSYGGRV